MYDKKLGSFSHPSIKAAAQERDFYDAKTEVLLNEKVERPANRAIDKLRRGERITQSERADLGLYIATMLKRVPKRRNRSLSTLPKLIDAVLYEIASGPTSARERDPSTRILSKADVNAIRESLVTNPPPSAIKRLGLLGLLKR